MTPAAARSGSVVRRKGAAPTAARWLLAGLSVLVSLGGTARAQTAADPAGLDADLDALIVAGGLTSEQAAARARVASPAVARKTAELDAAIAAVSAAELLRVPHVETALGYTRLSSIEEPDLAPGISLPVPLDNFDAHIQVVVPLSDYALRFPRMIEAARTGERAARIGKRAAELDAATEARLAYYEWVRSRLRALVAERQLQQVRATLAQIRALVEVGRMHRADLLRLESQDAEAQQALDRVRTISALREEMLRLRIGAPAGEPLAIGEDIRAAVVVPRSAELDREMATANRQRLDLAAIDLAIRAHEQQRLAERASQLPRLSAFASATYAAPNPRVFPPSEDFHGTWAAGAQLSWTLDGALRSRAGDRRMAAETRALRADRDALTRAARIEVMAAQQDVANAQRSLATSRKGLAAAAEGYRVRRALLDAERGTTVELVDAETDLTRARIAVLDARIDLRIALAKLTHALGDDAQ